MVNQPNRAVCEDTFPEDLFVAPCRGARVCFLDTETTGLDCATDEVIQLAIVSHDGTVAYSGYFKPVRAVEWPDAEKVNNISPSMLEGKSSLLDEKSRIESVLSSFDVVAGWNVLYDLSMLYACGIDFPSSMEFCDMMPAFCEAWRAEHPDYPLDRQRERLTRVTHWLGLDHDAHDALGDTVVLPRIWSWITSKGLS